MELDLELQVMQDAAAGLANLPEEARHRVIRWLADRFGTALSPPVNRISERSEPNSAGEPDTHEHFADFYHAVGPVTDKEKAVTAAYWVNRQGNPQFPSQEINSMLKDLGHGVSNITDALSTAMREKPALILQLKKSGTSRQARKLYKITDAGIKWVDAKLNADG